MTIVPKYSHLKHRNTHLLEGPNTWVSKFLNISPHKIPLNICRFTQTSQHCPLLIFITSNIFTILFMHLSLMVPNSNSHMHWKVTKN